jgi:hypothetical protein
LVAYENVECQEILRERLKEARAHERTLRRATAAVAVLAMLSVSGAAYAFLFEPRFEDTAPVVLKFCYILGLASLISLFTFLFLWARTRSDRRHLLDECRHSILMSIERGRPPVPSLTPLPAFAPLSEDIPSRKAV